MPAKRGEAGTRGDSSRTGLRARGSTTAGMVSINGAS